LKLGEDMMAQANQVQQIQAGLLVHFTETSAEQTTEEDAPQAVTFARKRVCSNTKEAADSYFRFSST
jgi:hypothetical protein